MNTSSARQIATTRVDDVELRVEEMSGETGDVVLMHPLCLHASSENCGSTPRIVLASTVLRKCWKYADPPFENYVS